MIDFLNLANFLPASGLEIVIPIHFISWAVLNQGITLLNLIRDKEIMDVDMSRSLAHRLATILL